MQLNELKEQYRDQLQDGSCQYEMEDMEDMILDSEDFDYLDESDGENIVTESEEKLDYVRL